MQSIELRIKGKVQGVGFRPFVWLLANQYGLRGDVNNEYKGRVEAAGMQCVGENPDTGLVEAVEVSGLRWFVGVQYHPEYTSTVLSPNPLFMGFIKAAINK